MISRAGLTYAMTASTLLAVACATSEAPPAAAPVPAPLPAPAPTPVPVPAPAPVVAPAPIPPAAQVAPGTPIASATPPPVGPPHRSPPTPHAWTAHFPTAWTDPRIVSALASSCDFVPEAPPADPGSGQDENIFACQLAYDQACMTNDCDDEQRTCKHACEATCTSCGASCAQQCGACEAACTDDSCKKTCATTTATCRQSCTRTMDRCSTGTCAKAGATCGANLDKAYKANHCNDRCDAYSRCRIACSTHSSPSGDAAEHACDARCEEALAPGYAACTTRCDSSGGSELVRAHCHSACAQATTCAPGGCM